MRTRKRRSKLPMDLAIVVLILLSLVLGAVMASQVLHIATVGL